MRGGNFHLSSFLETSLWLGLLVLISSASRRFGWLTPPPSRSSRHFRGRPTRHSERCRGKSENLTKSFNGIGQFRLEKTRRSIIVADRWVPISGKFAKGGQIEKVVPFCVRGASYPPPRATVPGQRQPSPAYRNCVFNFGPPNGSWWAVFGFDSAARGPVRQIETLPAVQHPDKRDKIEISARRLKFPEVVLYKMAGRVVAGRDICVWVGVGPLCLFLYSLFLPALLAAL